MSGAIPPLTPMRRLFSPFTRARSRDAVPPAGAGTRVGPALRLRSGHTVYPEAIEAHYRQSAYIGEIAVLGMASDNGAPEALHAVVVPDRATLEARRIANAGEIIRFEMDGRSVTLPPHERVQTWQVSFEPLPRDATGLARVELERRVRQCPGREAVAPTEDDIRWMRETGVATILDAVRIMTRTDRVWPAANLELDLGLDSMDRVELVAGLEARFGASVPEERLHRVFTVRDLVTVIQEHGGEPSDEERTWDAILASGPEDDPRRALAVADNHASLWLIHTAVRALVLLARIGIRWTVSGTEHLPRRGPYVICPNHQSYLDPFLVAGVLPYAVARQVFYVGATEYLEHWFAAWAARQVRLVAVDPDAQLVPAMRIAAFGLQRGRVLVLFPEGERSIDGTVRRFKRGAAVLAHHLQVPLVPVAIDGLYDLWPRNRPVAWQLLRPWRRHRIDIRIGPPLVPGRAGDPLDAGPARTAAYGRITEALRARVIALWEDARRAR